MGFATNAICQGQQQLPINLMRSGKIKARLESRWSGHIQGGTHRRHQCTQTIGTDCSLVQANLSIIGQREHIGLIFQRQYRNKNLIRPQTRSYFLCSRRTWLQQLEVIRKFLLYPVTVTTAQLLQLDDACAHGTHHFRIATAIALGRLLGDVGIQRAQLVPGDLVLARDLGDARLMNTGARCGISDSLLHR